MRTSATPYPPRQHHVMARLRWTFGRCWADRSTSLSDRTFTLLPAAAGLAAATVIGGPRPLLVGGFAAALVVTTMVLGRRVILLVGLLVCVVALTTTSALSARAALDRVPTGPVAGWARVVTEPQRTAGGLRIVVDIDGNRYEAWVRGRAMKIRVGSWRGGEWVSIAGVRQRLSAQRQGRVAWEHVVGELEIEYVADVGPANAADRASNTVRQAIERGADVLPGDDAALLRGLVIGDDRDQPDAMIDRFRRSGLSHLTAVSGQNVTFLLIAIGPLLQRLRPWWRWAATLIAIGWFVSLTRFEPSIVRAGTMAAISSTAFVAGRERSPLRLLSLAVTLLVIVDPLIVGSVGFWLSVGATAGVIVGGPPISAALDPLGPLADPIGITLGAQIGVVMPAMLVFGTLPLVSIPANVLAVPVAGFAMLYGLPASIVAGVVPSLGGVVMLPARIAVRWVDTVAALGARLEPDGAFVWWGWAVVAMVVLACFAAAKLRRSKSDPFESQRRENERPPTNPTGW